MKDIDNKRKSHNRVHKEGRDYDSLFNAEINEQARQRRQRKRNRRKTNAVIAFFIKLSRLGSSRLVSNVKNQLPEPMLEQRKPKQKSLVVKPESVEVPLIIKPEVTSEPIIIKPEQVVEPPTEPKVEPKIRTNISIFDKIKNFYQEFTDKAIKDFLSPSKDNDLLMFEEIKESLENTTVDDIITVDTSNKVEVSEQNDLVMEQVGFDLPELSVESDIEDIESDTDSDVATMALPEEEHTIEISPEIAAVVENLFGENDDQAYIESTEEVFEPEIVEAMKEVDYEHIMGIIVPKFANVIEKTDNFIDGWPNAMRAKRAKAKERLIALLIRIHLIPEDRSKTYNMGGYNKIVRFTQFVKTKALSPLANFIKTSFIPGAKAIPGRTSASTKHFFASLNEKQKPITNRVGTGLESIAGIIGKPFRFVAQKAEPLFQKEITIQITSAVGVAIVVLILSTSAYFESITGYKVTFCGSPIGTVKEKEDIYGLIEKMQTNLAEEHGVEIIINGEKDFGFTRERLDGSTLSENQILDKVNDINKLNVKAYALKIDDRSVAVLLDKKELETLLQEIKDGYVAGKDLKAFDEITFAEDVQILEVQAKLVAITNLQDAKRLITSGTLEEKIHKVQKGETLSEIAKNYGITTKQIQAANPNVDPTKLQINQKLSVIAPKPFITVQTVETKIYEAEIPFEIKYEDSNKLYKGESSVKTTGAAGKRKITAKITRENGLEIEREELESQVLKEAKTQVVLKGTKELPALLGTGKLQKPVTGTLTSRMGQRWSRLHAGIDIGASKGTSIKAADGGTIIYAGYDGNYGNTVRIDHGGNMVTVYAHCSKLLVKQGQKVAKGQQIATVGSTGRSTGPHLHFEVRINGKVKNPLDYVRY